MLFDDGDEVLIEDDGRHCPRRSSSPTRPARSPTTAATCRAFAADYAEPVRQAPGLRPPIRRRFAATYLEAFVERFCAIQQEYRKRKRAFDTLFKHRRARRGGQFRLPLGTGARSPATAPIPRELASLIEKILEIGIAALPGEKSPFPSGSGELCSPDSGQPLKA